MNRAIIFTYMTRPWPTAERILGWDPDWESKWGDPVAIFDPRYDPSLARLKWCQWWIEWALTQPRPGIDWSW